MELFEGRPADMSGRLDKEIRTYDLLDKLGIEYERVDHEPAETMEACIEIDRTLAPAVICKNLFLCNSQKTRFYLLAMRGDKKFMTKEISHQINSPRLSFATPDFMEKFLDITPGSVSVLGLMNDTGNNVQLLVDEDVLKEEYFGCHPLGVGRAERKVSAWQQNGGCYFLRQRQAQSVGRSRGHR